MILFRTHQFDRQARLFCEKLQQESGLQVVCLADESRKVLNTEPFEKISITQNAAKQLGLYCPKNFTWSCGDYGLYMAHHQYAQVKFFWLIEYDVRFQGENLIRSVIEAFDSSLDLVAPLLRQRQNDWWWYAAMASNKKPVYGCLFPLIRISAALIAFGLNERRRLGKSLLYRLFWPNDESFLATTAIRNRFKSVDLNSADATFYTHKSFLFDGSHSGEDCELSPYDELIYHPVLYGADYKQKQERLSKPTSFYDRAKRKIRLMLAAFA